jgi:hypothetical protein
MYIIIAHSPQLSRSRSLSPFLFRLPQVTLSSSNTLSYAHFGRDKTRQTFHADDDDDDEGL